jgi:hypothetical protein
MGFLSEDQIKSEYFDAIGGFESSKIIHEVGEYNGEDEICIACTQLKGEEEKMFFPDIKCYSEYDKKRILKEWINFLSVKKESLRRVHFNSKVTPALFSAVCCQNELEELRFKWGTYSDLSALEKMQKLKYLYIGQGSYVKDISPLAKLKNLIVLHIEAFTKIEDYSSLGSLLALEQLVITGPLLSDAKIKDLEFLRKMPSLRSVSFANLVSKKKYTKEELAELQSDLPNLHAVNNCLYDF